MVLALYPAFGVGQLARSYLVNVFVFHAWGIVYALFSVLLTAINAQSLGAMLAANSLGGWFQGASGALLPESGVNTTRIAQKWPKIDYSSQSCLQQSINSGRHSRIASVL